MRRGSWPALVRGSAGVLGIALMGAISGAAASPGDDHGAALAALADVNAAIATVVAAEDSSSTDPATYHVADQRAINALVGVKGQEYDPKAGAPHDAAGALGRIDALLDRSDTPRWADALHSAEANIRAAVARLDDARRADELMDHQIAVSAALENLLVAQGNAAETGAFGGLLGALSTTALGLPRGAQHVDACAQPTAAPSYGIHDGYLAYVALPGTPGTHALPAPFSASGVTVQGTILVFHTAVAPLVAKLCAQTGSAIQSPAAPIRQAAMPAQTAKSPATPAASPNTPPAPASAPPASRPALYTMAQARAGKEVYVVQCASCHGANLQGVAAPGVAGQEFLKTAQSNGWTLGIIRSLVFNLMPFNNPSSLTPSQYAEVTAYLLASNCFPAGKTPFPQDDQASFASIQLAPLSQKRPGENAEGVCPVQ